MTTCLRCHRPLKNPAINGMGPVCAKSVALPEVCRDLFGYDIEAAVIVARSRLADLILMRSNIEKAEIRRGFIQAMARLGVALQ